MNQKEIKFDFIVPGSKVGYLEEKLEKLNSTIYHVSSKRNNYIKHYLEVNKIIKNKYVGINIRFTLLVVHFL